MMMRRRKIRICLIVVVGLGLALIWSGEEPGPTIEEGSTLVLEVGGAYVEANQSPWLARLLGEGSPPFLNLLSLFALAERDSRLDRVVVVIRPLAIGWGKVGELREAIDRLEAAGHETVAYLDMAAFRGSREYFLASAADEVWVVPAGSVPVLGLAAEYYYLGGLWEKLGVEFDVAKAGRYKSAVEVYTATGMSGPSREMANSLLDSTNDFFLSGIAQARGLSVAELRAAIDQGPVLPTELEALGLIDGVEHLGALLDGYSGGRVRQEAYAEVKPSEVGFEPVAQVALIYGTGTVVSGDRQRSRGGDSFFAARSTARSLARAAADPAIDAIILRIDSPGGSALAAEEIWRSIGEARKEGKPIVASFSDVAASGGYYVAVAADEIVSNDATLTGSIGVFSLRPVISGGLEKLGIHFETLSRGRYADFMLSSQPLSEAAQGKMQDMVVQVYDLFLSRVAEGRDLEVGDVDKIAQGRVWTGSQAYEIGLVDHLGGLHMAMARVGSLLGLESDADIGLVMFPPPRSLSEEFADALNARLAGIVQAQLPLPGALHGMVKWLAELPTQAPLAVPPYLVEIN
jgi:protease-4